MDREWIRQTIMDTIIDEIVLRVSDKLVQLQKKALVVCTGSVLGVEEWIVSLKQLHEAGFSLDLFLSYGATNVLDVEKIQRAIPFGQVWKSNVDKAPEALASEYPTIIVPALTIATASRIAQCTADTPASRIIFNSMMRGKNVIIATDGCCPDNPKRKALGYQMTEPLQGKLRENLTILQSFGATLTSAYRMAYKVVQVVNGMTGTGKISHSNRTALGDDNRNRHVESFHRVIGSADIARLASGSVLRIAADSQVTQLARDMARMKEVKIVQERN